MTIISSAEEFNVDELFVDLEPLVGIPLFLKCEGMNFAGSIKLKAARSMLDAAEADGSLKPGDTIIESSSGNLGIALSLAAASRLYRFVCITDSRCNTTALDLMRAFGAEVQVVTTPHPVTGLLGARLERVRQLRDRHGWFWLNQYENHANPQIHRSTTGPQILAGIESVAVVFVGAGTCGTLMGVAEQLRDCRPDITIVAIDSVGSVTFGAPAAPRHIPGLGAGRRPPILDEALVDDVVLVQEAETVRACRALARRGFLFGGSTGTVVAGAAQWLSEHDLPAEAAAVAIAPDHGERYLDTVFNDAWVAERYGADVAVAETGWHSIALEDETTGVTIPSAKAS